MTVGEAVLWGQQALLAIASICGPLLLTALVVGGAVSILQAVTQIHEMTLVFVPKIVAVFVVILMLGGWMLDQAVDFGTRAFQAVEFTAE
jgi:flagellar biosynthetic protein FliQ